MDHENVPPAPEPPLPRWFQEQCEQIRDPHCRLQVLNLNIRKLSPPMVLRFAEVLQENTSLKYLNLTSALTVAAAQDSDHLDMLLLSLAMAVQQHPQLEHLHLSYNRLTDVPSLSTILLAPSSPLLYLNMDHNHLTDATAIELAEVLQTNKQLQALDLESNRITNVGGVALARSMRHNSTLRHLRLCSSSLGEATVLALLDTLQSGNVTLTQFAPVLPVDTVVQSKTCWVLMTANYYGRYLLFPPTKKQMNSSDPVTARTSSDREEQFRRKLWPLVLAKATDDFKFFFLREKPNLVTCYFR